MTRVRKQRDLDKELPEAPHLCNRATGSRWRPAAMELEGEAAVPPPEGAQEEEAAVALVQLSSSEPRSGWAGMCVGNLKSGE